MAHPSQLHREGWGIERAALNRCDPIFTNLLDRTRAGRYWIVNILWDDERQGLTLPEKYWK